MFRRIYNRLVREFKGLCSVFIKHLYRYAKPDIGTSGWFIKKEIEYGGMVTNVPRNKVSPVDPRNENELCSGGMTGGDRMFDHDYAPIYSYYISALGVPNVKTIAEFGILNGTGLAIWCDLFPDARVLGFDIDLDHFYDEEPALVSRGGFSKNRPELYEYDQLVDSTDVLDRVIGRDIFDVVIDDGLHTKDAIENTFNSVKPLLAEKFVYFVEDFGDLREHCGAALQDFEVHSYGLMSVILPAGADIDKMK